MAHDSKCLRLDPALTKWQQMTNERYKYFRWTPRTARIAFKYVFVYPAIVGVIAYWSDGRFDFRAKKRGDTILEY